MRKKLFLLIVSTITAFTVGAQQQILKKATIYKNSGIVAEITNPDSIVFDKETEEISASKALDWGSWMKIDENGFVSYITMNEPKPTFDSIAKIFPEPETLLMISDSAFNTFGENVERLITSYLEIYPDFIQGCKKCMDDDTETNPTFNPSAIYGHSPVYYYGLYNALFNGILEYEKDAFNTLKNSNKAEGKNPAEIYNCFLRSQILFDDLAKIIEVLGNTEIFNHEEN